MPLPARGRRTTFALLPCTLISSTPVRDPQRVYMAALRPCTPTVVVALRAVGIAPHVARPSGTCQEGGH